MKVQMKQRIIGGIVLLAILAIFLPVMFHSSRSSRTLQMSLKMPRQPQSPQVTLQLPSQRQVLTESQQAGVTATDMASKTKNQLIANSENHAKTLVSAIPQKSAAKEKPVTTPKTSLLVKPVASELSAPKKNSPPKKKLRKEKKLRHSKKYWQRSITVPKAWVVQLGTFGNSANAKRLILRLRKKGFDAYIRKSKGSNGKFYTKVFVGPELLKKRILRVKQRLQSDVHINGLVRPYTP